MSTWNANRTVRSARARVMDGLFVGGCTAAYLVLIGSVLAALRLYGG
ncbi:MAG TPA: hypothetical protein VGG29_13260 [Caulobacteraceae bacterium]|jgi:hypothetical protein